jgi:hypothetical protein
MKRVIAASQNWEKVYQISLFPHSLGPLSGQSYYFREVPIALKKSALGLAGMARQGHPAKVRFAPPYRPGSRSATAAPERKLTMA